MCRVQIGYYTYCEWHRGREFHMKNEVGIELYWAARKCPCSKMYRWKFYNIKIWEFDMKYYKPERYDIYKKVCSDCKQIPNRSKELQDLIDNEDKALPDFKDYGPGWSGKHYIKDSEPRPQSIKELDSDPSAPTTSVASTPRPGDSRAKQEEADEAVMSDFELAEKELRDHNRHTRRRGVNARDDDMHDD